MERFCRECGAPLSGRSDKQFYCGECRTSYHNRNYDKEKKGTAGVNRILKANRRLLEAVYAAGLRRISLKDKRLRGYDERYFTSVEHRPLRRTRYYCYEFSFQIRGGCICALAKH